MTSHANAVRSPGPAPRPRQCPDPLDRRPWPEVFYSECFDRVAQFAFVPSGRLVFQDEHTGADLTVPQEEEGRWKGFTHGSTLRTLIIELGAYVRSGQALHPERIAPACYDNGDNLWGYDKAAAQTLREQAHALPMFTPALPRPARRRSP